MRNRWLSGMLAAGALLAGQAALAAPAPDTLPDAAPLYARHCAACHGRLGAANGAAARDLRPPPRDFTRGQFRFRSTASGSLPAETDLQETIRHGLPGTAMPAFDGLLSERERLALARQVLAFAPEPMRTSEPQPVLFTAPPAGAAAEGTEDGRAVYLFLQCWTCHGLEGDGRGSSARGLSDETGNPIRPTDFRYAPFKGGRDVERVMRDLLAGLSGTPMPSYADALLYAREDVEDLTAFVDQLSNAERGSVAKTVAASPSRADLDALAEPQRLALRDERAAALARYVLAFDRRHGFCFRLFRQRPELEPRDRPALDASGLISPGEDRQ